MFRIGKLFHLTHVVDDLEAVDRWYDEVFAVNRFYNGYEELAGRNASLIAIGDVIMEPMMPAGVEPLKNPSVKKFHDRFGQHFHSIAWYVDDVQAISERLDAAGFRLFNLVGKMVKPSDKDGRDLDPSQRDLGPAGVCPVGRLYSRPAAQARLVESAVARAPARH